MGKWLLLAGAVVQILAVLGNLGTLVAFRVLGPVLPRMWGPWTIVGSAYPVLIIITLVAAAAAILLFLAWRGATQAAWQQAGILGIVGGVLSLPSGVLGVVGLVGGILCLVGRPARPAPVAAPAAPVSGTP